MAPEFSPEDLRQWQKDPKGAVFWESIRGMFADGVTNLRRAAAKGDPIESARYASHAETLEEVLNLPDLIIQQHARERAETKGEAK
jgi:hypothetical protein